MYIVTIFTSAMLGVALIATPALAAQAAQPTLAKAPAQSAKKQTKPAAYRQDEGSREKDRRREAREVKERRADHENMAEDRDDD